MAGWCLGVILKLSFIQVNGLDRVIALNSFRGFAFDFRYYFISFFGAAFFHTALGLTEYSENEFLNLVLRAFYGLSVGGAILLTLQFIIGFPYIASELAVENGFIYQTSANFMWYFHNPIVYGPIFLGVGLLLKTFIKPEKAIQRKQVMALLIPFFVIFPLNFLYLSGAAQIGRGIDITPQLFTIAAITIGVALLKYDLVSGEPIRSMWVKMMFIFGLFISFILGINYFAIFVLVDLLSATSKMTDVMMIVGPPVILIGVLLAFLLAKNIVSRISKVSEVAKEISEGNFDVTIEERQSDDEIGDMVDAVHGMIKNTAEPIKRIAMQQTPYLEETFPKK